MTLNNYCIIIGFIQKEPILQQDEGTNNKVCVFNIVVKDNNKVRFVECMATGRKCDIMMIHGIKGTFWAISGILYNHKSEKMKKSRLILKCLELELLHRPEVPGIGVEEFVADYAPEQIIKRAKERSNDKKKGTK